MVREKVWRHLAFNLKIIFFLGFFFFLVLFFPKKIYAAEYTITNINDLKIHCENYNTETLVLTQDLGLTTNIVGNRDQVITVNGNKTIIGNGHQIANYKTREYANASLTKGGNPIFGVNAGATLTTKNLTINGNRWGCNCKENSTIVVYNATYNAESGTVICQSVENGIQAFGGSRVNIRGNVKINENAGAGIGSWGSVSVDGADIFNNGAGIHARGSRDAREYTDIGGNTRIHDNKGLGLFVDSNATVRFNDGQIYNNRNGYGIEDYGECYFYHGSVYGNGKGAYIGAGGGIDGGKGSFVMKGGQICNNTGVGVSNNGTFELQSGQIAGNRVGVMTNYDSRFYMKGVNAYIHSNSGAGVEMLNGQVSLSDGQIYNNHNGVNNGKGRFYLSGSAKIHGNYGLGLYVGRDGIAEMNGGEIKDNAGDSNRQGGNVTNNGNFLMKGGSIHGRLPYGLINAGLFSMSGGDIYDCSAAGIYHSGNSTITGGRFRNNGYDVEHYGGENNGNLVIEKGAETVWLSSVGRYITTHSKKRFVITMPESCYKRKKILVHTDAANTAKFVCDNMEFKDKGAFTKRSVNKDVVVWDQYTQLTKHVSFDMGHNTWEKYLDDVIELEWAEETYEPKFANVPENYRCYALTLVDPKEQMPKDGETIRITVESDNTFYACYYPDKYYVHFDGNGATEGFMADQTFQYGISQKLNKNAFKRKFHVTYDLNEGSSVEKQSDEVSAEFLGWKVNKSAVAPSFQDEQMIKDLAEVGETRTLYAAWDDKAVILPNAGKEDLYWEPSLGWCKYYFKGWYTEPAAPGERKGTCVGWGGDPFIPKEDITLYAHWDYEVCVYYDGNTNDGGNMVMDDPQKGDRKPYQQPYIIRENGYTKEGYDFFGWNTIQSDARHNPVEDGNPLYAPGNQYTQDIPLTLFAAWRNRFDIAYMGICQSEGEDYFDNNNGLDYSQLSGTVKLNPASDMRIDTTRSFYDSVRDMDIVEDVTGTGVGWAFAKEIEAKYPDAYLLDGTEYTTADFFALARDAEAITYGSISQDYQGISPQLNSKNMAVVNMYRVWDYGPLVEAYDLYYTLEQAKSGYITEEELLSHALATDEEDGMIEAGEHEENSFRILDYTPEDFTSFEDSGSVTETYVATDRAGNRTRLQVTVYIIDTAPDKILPDRTVRFISEKYYRASESGGGLAEDSVWYTDLNYKEQIERAFANEKNNTPQEIYVFEHEDILKMQEFMDENGVCNEKSEDAKTQFYKQFMEPNLQK